jgi:hypothetical protein
MIEDTSTNGTYVDAGLLQAAKSRNRRKTAVGDKRTLESGLKVGIALAGGDHTDLRFIVRIPRREGLYDKAYTLKVKEYLDRIEALKRDREGTLGPGPTGHVCAMNLQTTGALIANAHQVDLFGSPHKTRPYVKQDPQEMPRDWDGSGKYNRVGMIGKGAFAVVYKLTSKFDGLPYAAKELEKRRFMKNGVLDQKIDNEMKIMQKVRHVSRSPIPKANPSNAFAAKHCRVYRTF